MWNASYAINGALVTTPDEEVWTPLSPGNDLNGLQKRSPFYQLEWRKQVASQCHLDWFTYDNTVLSSLLTRAPGELRDFVKYTTAVCQSVVFRQRRGVGNEVVATFLVRVP